MTGVLFLSPVFYPSAAAPEALRWLLQFNPLTAPIELARAAWFGDAFDWGGAAPQALALLLVAMAAVWLFGRLRPGFADLV
jgi:lipopolysaccharide transport system permease protein